MDTTCLLLVFCDASRAAGMHWKWMGYTFLTRTNCRYITRYQFMPHTSVRLLSNVPCSANRLIPLTGPWRDERKAFLMPSTTICIACSTKRCLWVDADDRCARATRKNESGHMRVFPSSSFLTNDYSSCNGTHSGPQSTSPEKYPRLIVTRFSGEITVLWLHNECACSEMFVDFSERTPVDRPPTVLIITTHSLCSGENRSHENSVYLYNLLSEPAS